MKQNKLVYQAPEAEIFEVKIDGGMLMASDPAHAYHQGGGGYYEDGKDTNDNGDF